MVKVTSPNQKLNFSPRSAWPAALPIFFWRDLQLTGFSAQAESAVLDLAALSDQGLLRALFACYPSLTFPEVARLHICLQELAGDNFLLNWERELWSQYGWSWNRNLEKTVWALTALPKKFQDWVGDKGLNLGDLAILRSLQDKDYSSLAPLCDWLMNSPVSKSEGTQILELAIELWQMGRLELKSEFDSYSIKKPHEMLTHLRLLRHPHSHNLEAQKKGQLLAIPWPAQVSTRWQRQGDVGSVEVKFNAQSLADLRKKIDGLEYTYQQLAKMDPELWTS